MSVNGRTSLGCFNRIFFLILAIACFGSIYLLLNANILSNMMTALVSVALGIAGSVSVGFAFFEVA